jgi:hypothetical protein
LEFDAILDLTDKSGRVAVFHRTEKIRFQQQGVAAILDHYWGSGVANVGYSTTAGPLGDLIHDQGIRHQVIELPRTMGRGEEFAFTTERTMMETFLSKANHAEIVIDHPVGQVTCAVLFPRDRPCQTAEFVTSELRGRLPVSVLPGGRTLIRVQVPRPQAHTPYRVEWIW